MTESTIILPGDQLYSRTDSGETRGDGWQNLFTLAGTRQDKTRAGQFYSDRSLDRQTLEGLYTTGGIARRIVSLAAQEMTREWFTLEGFNEAPKVMQQMEAVYTQQQVTWALEMGRLYGGALLVMLLDDGLDLDQPLNESGLREVAEYRVYDKEQVSWTEQMLNTDPKSKRFGRPETYQIQPISGAPYTVHSSRTILFGGLPVPDRMRQQNNHWDYSVLDPVWNDLQNDAEASTASAAVVQDFVQSVLSVNGLSDLLASGQEDVVNKRINTIDLSRHVLNMVLIDADSESYTKHASSVAGLPDLIDRLAQRVSAVSGYPFTKLWGRSPAGMNATGESDTRNYYDDLKAQQVQQLGPRMERLVRLHLLARNGPTRGKEPPEWTIKWHPLWQPSGKEQAEERKAVAETDAYYLDRGVLTPAEVAINRFGQGEYSTETVIDDDASRQMPPQGPPNAGQ